MNYYKLLFSCILPEKALGHSFRKLASASPAEVFSKNIQELLCQLCILQGLGVLLQRLCRNSKYCYFEAQAEKAYPNLCRQTIIYLTKYSYG